MGLSIFFSGTEYYDSLFRDIAKAKKTVFIETYILENDKTGHELKNALIKASERGVKTKLIFDAVGCLYLPEHFIRELEDADVKVLEFHPIRKSFGTIRSLLRRDHRKLAIIDDRIGYLGGMNIGDEYRHWRDCQLRVEGPEVRQMTEAFDEIDYIIKRHRYFYSRKVVLGLTRQFGLTGPLRIIRSIPTIRHPYIKNEYLNIINNSHDYLYITMGYFLPDKKILGAMKKAERRGVDVRVLLSKRSDVKIVEYASRYLYKALIKRGIRVFEYLPTFNHQKTIVADDFHSSVSSANLDPRSFWHNYEIGAFMTEKMVAEKLKGMFLQDLRHSNEVTLEAWARRPFLERIRDWFAYQFREFL